MFSSENFTTSVCMASYNGSRFIRQQIASILEQSVQVDEIIIVDDASSDKTIDVIRSFGDPRIRLIQNETNSGIVCSFETSIGHATGDLMFLCDQDDVWRSDKVSRFMRVFNDPEVTLALSDADIIDADGRMSGHSYFQARGGFVPGVMRNIFRNHYIGCTMAFRRHMLTYCLPFPKNLPMHDSWIGIVNDSFGKTAYIDEPLVMYRRHGQNVSRSGSLIQRIRWRFNLLGNLFQLRLRTEWGGVPISR